MSAWMVSDRHIDLLVECIHRAEIPGAPTDKNDLGRLLWGENLRSVHARYPDTEQHDARYPGYRTEAGPFRAASVDQYAYRPSGVLDLLSPEQVPALVADAVACWQYQTSDYDGHRDAPGWALITALSDGLPCQRCGPVPEHLRWGIPSRLAAVARP